MFLSIITPTWNRGYILGQCYQSLLKQTDRDFEWIVVNDGSTDNTDEVVAGFIAEGKITIRYITQANGGKHRAHNAGVAIARGVLTVCLDSDDALTPDAVQVAREIWSRKQGFYTGILAKRGDLKTGAPLCSSWPVSLRSSRLYDLIELHHFSGDTILFFATEILKEVPFKEFAGEKFLSELNLYCDIDRYGEMILHDQVLYLCEYLPDGLTARYQKLLKSNPNGSADTYYKQMCAAGKFMSRLKLAVLVNLYRQLSAAPGELHFTRHKILLFLTALPTRIFHKIIFRRLERGHLL